MNADQLEALCTSVAAGSVSAAARRLGVSQPTVSRRIQALETELGTHLVSTGATGVALTPAGQQVAAFGERVLADLAELRDALRTGVGKLQGTLRIVASTIPGEHLVPSLVAGFLALHPEVTADVSISDSAGVGRSLLAGAADVGFTGHTTSSDLLVHVPVAEDEVVLAVPTGHALAGQTEVDPEALSLLPFVGREAGSGTQRIFDEALSAAGLAPLGARARLTLGTTNAVLEAVRAGAGIGLVSLQALAHGGQGVSVLRLRGLRVTRQLYCSYTTKFLLLPQHHAFIAFSTHA